MTLEGEEGRERGPKGSLEKLGKETENDVIGDHRKSAGQGAEKADP